MPNVKLVGAMASFDTTVPPISRERRLSGSRTQNGAPRLSAMGRHFQFSLYLLLLISVLTLGSTGKLDLVSILAPPLALMVKGYRWWRGRDAELSQRAANWLVIAYLVFFPVDLWWVSRMLSTDAQNRALFAALLAAIHLMLFAMIVRLFSANSTRDYLFLAMLSFAAMLASAILTVDTMFLAFFFAYLVMAVSTFIGLEMRRGAEGAISPPLEVGTPMARRLHSALGVTSMAIAMGAVIAGAGIFFLIPRFNAGYFSRFDLRPSLMTGFNDNVELGTIGEIKRSSAVVMRIEIAEGPAAAVNVHWRGIALTTFDGHRWYSEARDAIAVSQMADGWNYLESPKLAAAPYTVPLHYTVLLEPVASDALFVASEPVKVRGQFTAESSSGGRLSRRSFLMLDKTGSISNPFHNVSTERYDAVSELPRVPADLLRAATTEYGAPIRDLYLQLPKLDPRIPALARQIVGRAANPYDRAHAIEQYLRTHYGYTLNLAGPAPADPLAYFLFQKRAGNCEYFAAAMTVMLRSLDVPTRYINGFLPGEYNDVGGDFIVRASDAHSWVEVFFPGYGWITFDPTPPGTDKPPGMLARLGLYWDYFDLQWKEWVINYDFFHQYTLAQNLQRSSHNWTAEVSAEFDRAKKAGTARVKSWQEWMAALPLWTLLPVALLAGLVLLLQNGALRERLILHWRLQRLGLKPALPPQAAALSYSRMLRLLERRGWRKSPAQTPLEFAGSLQAEPLRRPVFDLTEMYLAARFGNRSADTQRFAALLASLQAALRIKPAPR